jgi:hypothetical protein
MHDACNVTCELANPYWFYPGALVQRQTCRHAQPERTQPALFECADGYVYFALVLGDQKPWQVLVEWLDSAGMAIDLTDLPRRRIRGEPRTSGPHRVLLPRASAEGAYLEEQSGAFDRHLNAGDLFTRRYSRTGGSS